MQTYHFDASMGMRSLRNRLIVSSLIIGLALGFQVQQQCNCLLQCDVDRNLDAVQGCLQVRCGYVGSLASFRQACDTTRLVRRESSLSSSFSDGAVLESSDKPTKEPNGISIRKLTQPRTKPCTSLGSCKPVPNIIHFMFKTDISKMKYLPNPVWRESLLGWRKHFPADQWQYMFWDDESIDKQFKSHCTIHQKLFESFKSNISRADLGRYCILHEWGGIYSDLDYEPRTNFGDDFPPGLVSLVQSPYKYETLQNSLMASPPGLVFWLDLLGLAHDFSKLNDPTAATGPRLLDALSIIHLPNDVNSLRHDVHVLPCYEFQLKTHSDKNTGKPECTTLTMKNINHVKGIHWGTWSWYNIGLGKVYNKEIQDLFMELHRGETMWTVPAEGKPKQVKSDTQKKSHLDRMIDPAAFAPSAKNVLDLEA